MTNEKAIAIPTFKDEPCDCMSEEKKKYYKAFNSDLSCSGFKYEIGKIYKIDESPILCQRGFHFCDSLANVYIYYKMSNNTRVCEVEPLGEIVSDENGIKFVTNEIKIVKEIKLPQILANTGTCSSGYCNSGNMNSGNRNSGDYNSGDWNSGNRNSGDYNSGDWNSGINNSGDMNLGNWNSGHKNSGVSNSGNYNSGDWNPGDCNSGNMNSGDYNSGYWNSGYKNSGDKNSGDCNTGGMNSGDYNSGILNSGDYNSGDMNSGNRNSGNMNSGDWNSGDGNSGIFNTDKEPKIKMFNKESSWTYTDWRNSIACYIMMCCPYTHSDFISEDDMTDEEKEMHKEYKTVGGYVKVITVTAVDRQKWWNDLDDEDKREVLSLPNFDAKIFKECTEIDVENSEIEETTPEVEKDDE